MPGRPSIAGVGVAGAGAVVGAAEPELLDAGAELAASFVPLEDEQPASRTSATGRTASPIRLPAMCELLSARPGSCARPALPRGCQAALRSPGGCQHGRS